MFQPLTIQITNSQKPILEEAIENFNLKSLVKMGDGIELNDGSLIIDAIDFCSILHYMDRSSANEMELFRIKTLGKMTVEKRLSQCKSTYSQRHYKTVLMLLEKPEIGASLGQPSLEERRTRRPKSIAILA